MSVRALNPLEQHAGKIFLGVVLLICAILVWLYVVGDPVQIKIDTRTVSIDEAQRELESIAKKISAQTEANAPLRDPKNEPPVANNFRQPNIDFGKEGPLADQLISPIGSIWQTGGSQAGIVLTMLDANPSLLLPPPKPLLDRDRRQINVKGQGQVACNYVSVSSLIPADAQKFITNLKDQAASATRPWPLSGRNVLLVVAVEIERQTVDDNGNPVGPPVKLPPPDFGMAKSVYDLAADRVAKAVPPPPANAAVAQWIDWGNLIQAWIDKNVAPQDKQERIRRPLLPDGTTSPKVTLPEIPATEPENPDAPAAPAAPGLVPPAIPPAGEAGGVAGAAPVGSPNPILWAVDDKVESGKQYRYRIRYVIFNPLAGKRMEVQELDRNVQVFASPWSVPSEPITIEQDLFYFGRGVSASGVVEFDIYRRMPNGLYRQMFRAQVGENLGGKAKVTLTPAAKAEEVDFSTHLLVVDVRQGDAMIKQGPAGRKELVPMTSMQVVVQNEAGQMFVRNIEVDKANPEKAKLDKEIEAQGRPH